MAASFQSETSFVMHFVDNTATLPVFLICSLWFAWRLWKFTLSPNWYPDKPKAYPYAIPFIGHSFSFFRGGDGTFTRARQFFKNARHPFKLVIMGETVYVVTSPHDTAMVHKQVKNLSMDGWINDLMEQFGASPASIQAMWDPVRESKDDSEPKEFQKAVQNASDERLIHGWQLWRNVGR